MRTAHLDLETLGIAQRDPAWTHAPEDLSEALRSSASTRVPATGGTRS
ncbi:hypothetical protein [Haliangium ochraceum]|uniref:Uncharacterized protein n=1 Tax=Haliangium ochraceum (strain DSM 14365 / JCM 11303 / SMP-2) TaxID=502025 RepID=D0LR88_HALO1|nr:hypothetical protein [Haliangium ochraceum]ACY17116.1 hypothetical protein Hoch_4625 [Haliangium ochraceum DSM 14365]